MGSGLLTPGHLVILAIIALLVFGPKRLPELGRSLGSGMRGFKKAIEGDDDEDDRPATPAQLHEPAQDPGVDAPAAAATATAEPTTAQRPAPPGSP
jgi:sec-independent protein translocase protein TatA